jgi:hypothetical protein
VLTSGAATTGVTMSVVLSSLFTWAAGMVAVQLPSLAGVVLTGAVV